MPVRRPAHVEHTIQSSYVQIVLDDGSILPAYWAYPEMAAHSPAVAVIHDWWGITDTERRMAHRFAALGYYVIIPDLFDGRVASTPQEAQALVKALGAAGYPKVDAALHVLEHHARVNHHVAAFGLGMGGTLALQAALSRADLEAAVACYGFPQRFLGRFKDVRAPVLALYGAHEPHIAAEVIARLRAELALSPLPHEVIVLPNAARDFINDPDSPAAERAWEFVLAFLERYVPPVRVEAS